MQSRLGRRHYNKRHHHSHPFLMIFMLFLLIGAFAGGFKLRSLYLTLPHMSKQRLLDNQSNYSKIKAANGSVIWGRNRNRELVAKKQEIPSNLKNALTSIEDRQFYHEGGVNYLRTFTAVVEDFLIHHNREQGGSTLTEQLVKNSFFNADFTKDKTIKRKIQEIMLAEKLNHEYGKNTIMNMYINKVFMGSGIYGMKTASLYYFNKPMNQLSLTQSAILAGMVQSPTLYDPYNHPAIAKARRNIVISAMAQNHKISNKKAEKLRNTPLRADIIPLSSKINNSKAFANNQLAADDYTQSVLGQLERMHVNLNSNSVNVQTALDLPLQKKIINLVSKDKSIPWPDKNTRVAVSVINNRTGQPIAQVGNRFKKRVGSFDQATSPERSTGSTIKPILDYAPAMDDLGWSTGHSIRDSHYDYPGTNTPVYDWDENYQGKLTVARALMNSRNIPAVKTLASVGLRKASMLANLAGIPKVRPYYSSAIGANASVVQLATAYTSLANYGSRKALSYLSNYAIGKNKPRHVIQPTSKVMSPQTAFMLDKVLEHIPQKGQLGSDAHINGANQAGKTGTTGYANANAGRPKDAISDAWYVGYDRDYTIAVWTGYKNPKYYLRQKNANISELIYRSIMEYLMKYRHDKSSDWTAPSNIGSYRSNGMSQYFVKNSNAVKSPSLAVLRKKR